MIGVAMVLAIVLLAIAFGPKELGKPPAPSIIQAYPRPDWYFLWYFAVLALLPAGVENFVGILVPVLLFLVLVLLPSVAKKRERDPRRRPWAIASALTVVLMIGTLCQVGVHAPWSPNFDAQPLSAQAIGALGGPVYDSAQLFNAKGCQYCHKIDRQGGNRGPDLTNVANRLNQDEITIRILNGGGNMPAYGGNLTPAELNAIIAFLESRKGTS